MLFVFFSSSKLIPKSIKSANNNGNQQKAINITKKIENVLINLFSLKPIIHKTIILEKAKRYCSIFLVNREVKQ